MTNRKLTASDTPTFRYVEDVVRYLALVNQEVDELGQLATQHRRSLTKSLAGFNFNIVDDRGASGDPSPKIETKNSNVIKLPLDKMEKSYNVMYELTSKLENLAVVEAQLSTDFKDTDVKKALNALRLVRSKIEANLKTAKETLQQIAQKHIPVSFSKFADNTEAIIENAIQYESVDTYMYVYTQSGLITFSRYYELTNALDADGKTFKTIIVVASCQFGTDPTPTHFVATLSSFVVPGRFHLGKKLDTDAKGAVSLKHLQTAMSMVLQADSFSSGIDRLPIATILNPKAIQPSVFSYHKYIDRIEFEEEAIAFVLKKEVKDLGVANKVGSQLFTELLTYITRKTGIRLKMAIKVDGGHYNLIYIFIRQGNQPAVSEQDLAFLKDRFGMPDHSIKEVVKIINLD